MPVTIKKGLDNSFTFNPDGRITLGDVRKNTNYQATLEYAASDKFRVNGYEVPDTYVLQAGDTVSVEKAACTKAA